MAKSKPPRKSAKRVIRLINPFEFTRQKQAMESFLSDAEISRHVLPAWIYLDAVLSGKACEGAEGGITRHIVMLQVFASSIGNKPLYDLTAKTVTLWLSALDLALKRKQPVDLSTSARNAVTRCVIEWNRALYVINVQTLVYVCRRADAIISKYVNEEQAA